MDGESFFMVFLRNPFTFLHILYLLKLLAFIQNEKIKIKTLRGVD